MRSTFKTLLPLLGAILLAASLTSGCAWSIGGKREGSATIQPTKGQELVDLKRALDSGAITPDEYESQRKAVLSR